MSPLQLQDRLDDLASSIRVLRTRVLELERAAGDLSVDDVESVNAGAEAFMAKARLDAALHEYFDRAELVRDRVCPIHGTPNPYLPCPDCVRISDRVDARIELKSA